MSQAQGWIIIALIALFLFKHWWSDRVFRKERNKHRKEEEQHMKSMEILWNNLVQSNERVIAEYRNQETVAKLLMEAAGEIKLKESKSDQT